MIWSTLKDLAEDVRTRRRQGEDPMVLLLGAGASKAAGIRDMTELFATVGVDSFDAFIAYIEPRLPTERYRILADFLQTQDPEEVTPGYRALAALCADGYFDLVLTTNLDPLLDDALAEARLRRRDYLLLINGLLRGEHVGRLLTVTRPRVKVLKLHGDLFQRYMAWTPAEMDDFVDEIDPRLEKALDGQDVLVVGQSLRDARIRRLVERAGGAVWYAAPTRTAVPDFLAASTRTRAVAGDDGKFEALFTGLAAALGVNLAPVAAPVAAAGAATNAATNAATDAPPSEVRGTTRGGTTRGATRGGTTRGGTTRGASGPPRPPSSPVPIVRTVDDLTRAVVKIIGRSGEPEGNATGFILASPRVIVAESWAMSQLDAARRVTIEAADGRRFTTPLTRTRRRSDHPFAPALLAVPDEIKVPGLALAAEPLRAGAPVQLVVAAGRRVGLSTGQVQDPAEQVRPIDPVGDVGGLIQLEADVAPGSSGAPVVDAALAVCGYIVASRPDRPEAYMYPAARWELEPAG